jgi:hypothetical protein
MDWTLCTFQRNEQHPWQKLNTSIVILTPANRKAHELNTTAGWLWTYLAAPRTYGETLSAFRQEFEVSQERLGPDLKAFLTRLQQENLIEILN